MSRGQDEKKRSGRAARDTGFKEAAEYIRDADRPPAVLTIRDASALTALRQQARVVETYNEKIMNPVHQVCLECEPGVYPTSRK